MVPVVSRTADAKTYMLHTMHWLKSMHGAVNNTRHNLLRERETWLYSLC